MQFIVLSHEVTTMRTRLRCSCFSLEDVMSKLPSFTLLSSLLVSLIPISVAQATPVEFQKIPAVMEQFKQAELYRKKSATLGRLPLATEIGKPFPTYVSDNKGGYTLETENVISNNIVIASMPKPIVNNIYNQWLVPKNTWVKTYGELPTETEFKPFQRIKTIKAIKIDDSLLKLLGSQDGETATIQVSWDPKGMKVYKDGYLADYEYGIAPDEMKANYEKVK